jgi:hypothetical protein
MAATENQDFVLEAATNLLTKTVHEWLEIQEITNSDMVDQRNIPVMSFH